jgi:hypothetical protein
MPLVVPNSAETFILGYILKKHTPEDLDIRLFTNDHIPTEGDVVGNFIEATGGGYATIQLDPTQWVITPGEPSLGEHPQVSWVFTGGVVGNVYGYYVTRRSTGDLVWAERFSNGPYLIQTANDQIRVTPRLTAN